MRALKRLDQRVCQLCRSVTTQAHEGIETTLAGVES